MPIYPPSNPLIEKFVETTDQIVESTHSLAASYEAQNEWANSLPIENYLAFLNDDVESTLERLTTRDAAAAIINAQLDAAVAEKPSIDVRFSRRIPTGISREGVSFDEETQQFIYTPPTIPEIEPEP